MALILATTELSMPYLGVADRSKGKREPGRPGLIEALGDGWGTFVAGGYAVVLGAATVLPFLPVAALVVLVVVWVRRTVRRGAATASRQA
jgi:heme exporter protein D